MGSKTVYVAYCVKKAGQGSESFDEWFVVMACPPKPGKVNWSVSEVKVGQKHFYPTLETAKAKVDTFLQPMLDQGYMVVEESEYTVRQLSVLPCPLVLRDRGEWLQFLRNKYPRVAVVSPLINAGKRRHLARTKNRPPLFIVLMGGDTGLWVHKVHTFWADLDASERTLKAKRSAAISDLKSKGYFVVQVSLAQAHAMSGRWGDGHSLPWEYPFLNWDEYLVTMSEETRERCPYQRGKEGPPLFTA